MRHYGRDFYDRLNEAGFGVLVIPKTDLLAPVELDRASVACDDEVVLCRKIKKFQQ